MRNLNFLGLDETGTFPETADVLIQPIPYDSTTSYQPGTRFGPEAILQASQQVELWDETLGWEPFTRFTTMTLPAIPPNHRGPEFMAQDIRAAVRPYHLSQRLVTALGGEHSITYPLVESLLENHPDLVVCWLDAHADLRESWEGSRFSHACGLRRIAELNLPIFHLGLRSLSREEQVFIQDRPNLQTYSSEELLSGAGLKRFRQDLRPLAGSSIYLSVDIDVLDPGLVPGTGTPEPGGLTWYPLLETVRIITASGFVRGLDLCELLPLPGCRQSEFIAAKLVFKILSQLLWSKEHPRHDP